MTKVEKDANNILNNVKYDFRFPVDTGKLRESCRVSTLQEGNKQVIVLTIGDETTPYVKFLEEGTTAHDIPRAFGRELPFGIGGRFNGKFHPGSTKHKGFIEAIVRDVVDYLKQEYETNDVSAEIKRAMWEK